MQNRHERQKSIESLERAGLEYMRTDESPQCKIRVKQMQLAVKWRHTDDPRCEEGQAMSETGKDYLDKLVQYYANVQSKIGFARKCRMHLPANLEGMRIIDIGCRNGKGVMKLAGNAGSSGYVLGIDWLPEHVEAAKVYAHERSSRPKASAPYEFRVGYPEALGAAGVGEAEFDAAFVNCSMNLFYDIPQAFAQINRCLKPGGLLIVDGVFADGPRDERVVQRARALDNSVQAAPALDEFLRMLDQAGFADIDVEMVESVEPDAGFTDETTVTCVNGIETVGFDVCVVQGHKRLA